LGRPDLAARLAGAAEAQRDRSGYRWRHAPLDAEVAAILADDALRDAVAEGRRLSLAEAVAYATRARGPRGRAAHGWDALTPAEQEVTRLVGEGCTNQQIADRLFVSVATIKTHLVHTYNKLDVRSRAELAAQAARRLGPAGP
jgi:DNA-binding NarL/FixJ family response regulator